MINVKPIRDVAAEDIKVSEFLNGLKSDAAKHMALGGEAALSHDWDEAEIHVEIALDRIKMHNEIRVEMENYR